jgi:hypothetical protein
METALTATLQRKQTEDFKGPAASPTTRKSRKIHGRG